VPDYRFGPNAGVSTCSSQALASDEPQLSRRRLTSRLSARSMRASGGRRTWRSDLVLGAREMRMGGDARISGKEQPAGSRASCRPLLRFVRTRAREEPLATHASVPQRVSVSVPLETG
jgi:hypothetical protein